MCALPTTVAVMPSSTPAASFWDFLHTGQPYWKILTAELAVALIATFFGVWAGFAVGQWQERRRQRAAFNDLLRLAQAEAKWNVDRLNDLLGRAQKEWLKSTHAQLETGALRALLLHPLTPVVAPLDFAEELRTVGVLAEERNRSQDWMSTFQKEGGELRDRLVKTTIPLLAHDVSALTRLKRLELAKAAAKRGASEPATADPN